MGSTWAISLKLMSFPLVVIRGLTCPVACGILVPWPGIGPMSPALKAVLNHWTSWRKSSTRFLSLLKPIWLCSLSVSKVGQVGRVLGSGCPCLLHGFNSSLSILFPSLAQAPQMAIFPLASPLHHNSQWWWNWDGSSKRAQLCGSTVYWVLRPSYQFHYTEILIDVLQPVICGQRDFEVRKGPGLHK